MPRKKPVDTIAQVVKTLYDAGAYKWTIQDKGTLLAAIKLQLQEKPSRAR